MDDISRVWGAAATASGEMDGGAVVASFSSPALVYFSVLTLTHSSSCTLNVSASRALFLPIVFSLALFDFNSSLRDDASIKILHVLR